MKRGSKPKFNELGSSPAKNIYGYGGLDDAKAFDIKYKQKTTSKNVKTKAINKPAKAIDRPLVVKKKTSVMSGTTRAPQNTPKQYAKASKKYIKKGVKQLAKRGAGRLAAGLVGGGAGVLVSGVIEAYKSGQKHSGGKVRKDQKSFMADAKKKTKSIWNKK